MRGQNFGALVISLGVKLSALSVDRGEAKPRGRSNRRLLLHGYIAGLILALFGACGEGTNAATHEAGAADTSIDDAKLVDSKREDQSSSEDDLATKGETRIYVAFVSHNEEEPHRDCTPVITQQAAYLANRGLVVEMAKMIVDKGAALDFQSDWQYLEGVKSWDTASVTANTERKNIIRYLAELSPQHIVVDAHAHETQYNYADVVHSLERLGIQRNGVVGGFLYQPVEDEKWTRLTSPLVGTMFPETSWQAEILWGAATKYHAANDSVASGIWRPKDAVNFHRDDPTQTLVNVGGFKGRVDDLLARLDSGQLQEGRMYTATIFVAQCTLSSANIASMAQRIDDLAPAVAAGKLVWATLPKMVEIWRSEYGSTPVILNVTDGSGR